jgi:hypothetical protein
VLVVVQQFRNRAHGTIRVISGHAVGQFDAVAACGHPMSVPRDLHRPSKTAE